MSLMQNIRLFAQIKLRGVIPWEAFKFPDETHTDTAKCVIEGKKGVYRITVISSYAVPPLGRVEFRDGDHEIVGQNQDAAWHQIAEYLLAKEGGVKAETTAEVPAPQPASIARIVANPLAIPPHAFVYYYADPGVWYQNGPALVTRVNADGSYNLTIFPDGSEPFFRQNVRRQSDTLKNVCWVEYPQSDGIYSGDLEPAHKELMEHIEELRAQIAELAARRGPGRPPKVA